MFYGCLVFATVFCVAPDEDPTSVRTDVKHNRAGIGPLSRSSHAIKDELPLLPLSKGSIHGTASVVVEKRIVYATEPLPINVRFVCDSGHSDIFDPFFSTGDPGRASLRVFNEAGDYVGNALAPIAELRAERKSWLSVRQGAIIGRTITIFTTDKTHYVAHSDGRENDMVLHLGEGKYFLQFVLSARFLDGHDDDEFTPRLRVREGSAEICRSNILSIEVLPKMHKDGSPCR